MKRKLSMRHGTEGPRHDPYSFTEYVLREAERTVTLHLGLLERCTIETTAGRAVIDGDDAGPRFELETGLSVSVFEKSFNRLHPYDEYAAEAERLAGWDCRP